MVAGRSSRPATPGTARVTSSTAWRRTNTSWSERPSASGSKPSENVRHAWGSRSTSRVRRSRSAKATPRECTVVVLATPPFWLATAGTLRNEVRRSPGSEAGHAHHGCVEDEAPRRAEERRAEGEDAAVRGDQAVAAAVVGLCHPHDGPGEELAAHRTEEGSAAEG